MFPALKRRAVIGVGTKVGFAPPSEPDRHISCIRLSSWWLAFKKIGVPQRTLVLRRTSPPRRSRYLAIGSYQPKPFPSFNPRFQGRQHALRPDRWFYPSPPGSDVSPLLSRFRHCRGWLFRRSVFHASTFLPPFAPRALPRFFATTEALSPPGYSSSGLPRSMNSVPFPVRDP
jgi:hypothetical protein